MTKTTSGDEVDHAGFVKYSCSCRIESFTTVLFLSGETDGENSLADSFCLHAAAVSHSRSDFYLIKSTWGTRLQDESPTSAPLFSLSAKQMAL